MESLTSPVAVKTALAISYLHIHDNEGTKRSKYLTGGHSQQSRGLIPSSLIPEHSLRSLACGKRNDSTELNGNRPKGPPVLRVEVENLAWLPKHVASLGFFFFLNKNSILGSIDLYSSIA